MIAVHLTTTIRAGVPPDGKPFGNRLATLCAYLRRVLWVHFYHDTPGTCSLCDQDAQEEAPSGVGDRFRKGMVPYHPPNVQLFNRHLVVLVDQRAGSVVGEVLSRPLDLEMRLCQQFARLTATIAPLDPARETTLCLFQFALGGSIVTGIGDLRSVRQRCEGFQSDIHTDHPAGGRKRRRGNFTGYTRVPAIRFAHDRAGFRCAFKWTVGVEPECADLGEVEPPVYQLDPVAPLRIGEAIVPSPALEARIARLLASFDAPKEG